MAIPHNSKCRYGERGAAAAGAVLKPQGGNCAVLPYVFYGRYQYLLHIAAFTFYPKICTEIFSLSAITGFGIVLFRFSLLIHSQAPG